MPAEKIVWTNKSVVKFAGSADPISLIEDKARELVLQARDTGWAGPPYNPLAIADLLKIPVEANSEISDARTIKRDDHIRIEFNPTKPRERVRFSIAHEIAHALFSDVGEKTRHRGGPASTSDEWQLEMLCNLAAAEFVMPLGSLPARDRLPRIEELMIERRKFDVSAEAFLIRVIKTTAEPALMFCASAVEKNGEKPAYWVDYSVGSKSSPASISAGLAVPESSIVYLCTAIGQTNRGDEAWVSGKKLSIEYVGIPGFTGTTYPRIAGIVRFKDGAEKDPLKFVQGDVLAPVGPGNKIVCQLVNDQARVWGGGVARTAAKKYPAAQQQFTDWFIRTTRSNRLGSVHFANAEEHLVIASLVAQHGYGDSLLPRIRYAALERCFSEVARSAREQKASVHLPRIGGGQSGGDWSTIEEIIRDAVVSKGVDVTVYDLPPKRQTMGAELFA